MVKGTPLRGIRRQDLENLFTTTKTQVLPENQGRIKTLRGPRALPLEGPLIRPNTAYIYTILITTFILQK